MRKKLSILIYYTIVCFSLFCGDNIYGIIAYPPVQSEEYDYYIPVQKEIYTLDLNDDYYSVDMLFEFNNLDDSFTTKLAIPVLYGEDQAKLYDFSIWINGVKVNQTFKSLSQGPGQHLITVHEPPYHDYETYKKENTYFTEVTLNTGITTFRINYKHSYDFNNYENNAHIDCYYGVDESFGNFINSFTFNIENHSHHILLDYGQIVGKFNWKNDDVLIYENTDGIGTNSYSSYSFVIMEGYKSQGSFIERLPELLEDLNKSDKADLLMEMNLGLLPKNQLRILRNGIYAYHGYSFKSKDLQDLFKSTSWYKVNPDYSDKMLTENEKNLIKNIQTEESKFN